MNGSNTSAPSTLGLSCSPSRNQETDGGGLPTTLHLSSRVEPRTRVASASTLVNLGASRISAGVSIKQVNSGGTSLFVGAGGGRSLGVGAVSRLDELDSTNTICSHLLTPSEDEYEK